MFPWLDPLFVLDAAAVIQNTISVSVTDRVDRRSDKRSDERDGVTV